MSNLYCCSTLKSSLYVSFFLFFFFDNQNSCEREIGKFRYCWFWFSTGFLVLLFSLKICALYKIQFYCFSMFSAWQSELFFFLLIKIQNHTKRLKIIQIRCVHFDEVLKYLKSHCICVPFYSKFSLFVCLSINFFHFFAAIHSSDCLPVFAQYLFSYFVKHSCIHSHRECSVHSSKSPNTWRLLILMTSQGPVVTLEKNSPNMETKKQHLSS